MQDPIPALLMQSVQNPVCSCWLSPDIPWFSAEVYFLHPPNPHQVTFGKVWRHFVAVMTGERCGWYLVGRSQDAVKHPTMHRAAPQETNNLLHVSAGPRLRSPSVFVAEGRGRDVEGRKTWSKN